MNILCLTPVHHIEGVCNILSLCGNVSYSPDISYKNLLIAVNQQDYALFVNPNQMEYYLDEKILSKVKVVCTASTGTNHIDMEYCKNNDVDVLSLTTDYDVITKISSTAEMAFALTLSLIRNIPSAFESAKEYDWTYEKHIGRQLNQLVAGVVGYGRLGKMYAHYCKSFGMKVLISDPYKKQEIKDDGYVDMELDDLIANSDIISLHVHLTNETRGMINDDILRNIKPGSGYLINTSRGDIVVESDVISAIEDYRLLGYATDVISDELGDVSQSNLIFASKSLNIIVTPHIAGMTKEAQEIAYCAAANKLLNYMKDKNEKD